jgi:hypothetical protein
MGYKNDKEDIMSAIIQTVASVEPYGENLSIVTTSEGHKVIANRKEDGSFRWTAGEVVCYISEGSIIPDDVLKERGYWDAEKDRGLLDGGKRNRVKMKKLAGFESRGLLFKVMEGGAGPLNGDLWIVRGDQSSNMLTLGDDVSEFLGIVEFQG